MTWERILDVRARQYFYELFRANARRTQQAFSAINSARHPKIQRDIIVLFAFLGKLFDRDTFPAFIQHFI